MGVCASLALIAAAGALPPVAGALFQEAIDIGAVLNALRASFAPRNLVDFESGPAGDAVATAKVLIRLLRAARERGCETLEDLRMITRRPTKRNRHKRRRMPGWTDGEMTA